MAATAPAAWTGPRPPRWATRCCCRPWWALAAPPCCCWPCAPSSRTAPCTKNPRATSRPPFWIRALLVLTCTGVSFAHGSNDGQKGMGLIMLILVGTVPMAYALNRAMPIDNVTQFVAVAHVTQESLLKGKPAMPVAQAREALSTYVCTKALTTDTLPAIGALTASVGDQVKSHGSLAKVPMEQVSNVRNDMYLLSEAL